jgi:2-polyprenyl-3-methyl-5-hydroxy-6-metoxy-1,4-benzoquinol methylase
MSNVYDVIIGSDVMEHIEDYDSFFRTTQRVLVSGGKAIFMSPIILNEDGLYRTRDFEHPDEHCWVHTQKFLEPYLKEMFSEVKFTRWIVGHEMIILTK